MVKFVCRSMIVPAGIAMSNILQKIEKAHLGQNYFPSRLDFFGSRTLQISIFRKFEKFFSSGKNSLESSQKPKWLAFSNKEELVLQPSAAAA